MKNCEICLEPLTKQQEAKGRKTCSKDCAKSRKKSPVFKRKAPKADVRQVEFERCSMVNRFLLMPVRS